MGSLMDTAGTPLTEPLYKSIGNAENNRIPAKAKDGWLYLDYAGKKQLLLKRGGRCHRVQKRKSRRQDRW